MGQLKATLDSVDEEGDTALHVLLYKRASIHTEINENEAPTIHGVCAMLQSSNLVG